MTDQPATRAYLPFPNGVIVFFNPDNTREYHDRDGNVIDVETAQAIVDGVHVPTDRIVTDRDGDVWTFTGDAWRHFNKQGTEMVWNHPLRHDDNLGPYTTIGFTK